MLLSLYSHVVEAICVFLPLIIPPQQNCFEFLWVLVALWQLTSQKSYMDEQIRFRHINDLMSSSVISKFVSSSS
jgi:hypothetical protein